MTTATAGTLRATAATRETERKRRGRGWGNLGLLGPFCVFYVLFLIGPLVYDIVMSFFNTSLVLPGLGSFAGVANYRELFTDGRFWQAMWHTILFTLVSTPPLVILPLFFAIVVNRISRGQWFFRLAFFMPYILPSATIALIWSASRKGASDMAVSAQRPAAGGAARHAAPRARGDRRAGLFGRVVTGVVIALALIWLIPVAWTLDTSVKAENDTIIIPATWNVPHFTFSAYGAVFSATDIGRWYINSVIVAVVVPQRA